MTPEETEVLYAPLRLSVQAVTSAALKGLYPPDIERAARRLGLWKRNTVAVEEDTEGFETIMDGALMEPNPLGVRPFDRFVEQQGASLTDDDRAVAGRMTRAWFSLFRVVAPHPSGGVTLVDLLHDDREIWVMDRGLGQSAKPGIVLAMRVFDAGPFHMGFGIVATLDDVSAMILSAAAKGNWDRTFRMPLSAVVHGHTLGTGLALRNAVTRTAGRLKDMVRRSALPDDDDGPAGP